MTTLIEIEGTLARIVERNVIRSAALEDFLPLLENRPPTTIANLPRGTVAIHQDLSTSPERMAVLIEMRPQIRVLHDKPGYGADVRDYRVALPYTFFYFTMQRITGVETWDLAEQCAFHSRHQYSGLDMPLIPALLPNVYSDGRICFGNTGNNPQQPLHERIDEIVNGFYQSNFDSSHHIRDHAYPFGGQSFKRWVTKTEANPNCWQEFPEWDPTSDKGMNHQQVTVREVLATRFPPRTDAIALNDAIPELYFAPTFGRAEEWALGLNNTQRFRLLRALENIQAEDPEAVIPDLPPAVEEDEDDD